MTFFDLESPTDLQKLASPEQTLRPLRGLVVIEEVQRLPELFPILRVLLDRSDVPARFLLTGSASLVPLWSRGGFPRSFLAVNDRASLVWRLDFVRTFFLERDLPQLGITISGRKALQPCRKHYGRPCQ